MTSRISTPCEADQRQNSVGEVDPDRHRSRFQRLGNLGPHQTELAAARRNVVVGPEFRYADPPLITLSHANIGVVDDVLPHPERVPCWR